MFKGLGFAEFFLVLILISPFIIRRWIRASQLPAPAPAPPSPAAAKAGHDPLPEAGRYDFILELNGTHNGRGYVVRRTSDGQRLNYSTLARQDGLEAINVVGESRRMEVLQHPSFGVGAPLTLIPEPTNPVDPYAVRVCDSTGTKHIGYIPKEQARRIGTMLTDKEPPCAISMWESFKPNGERCALRILLIQPWASVKIPEP